MNVEYGSLPMPRNPKHQAFVLAYLVSGVGRQAAIEAGFAEGSASNTAYKLLKRPDVRTALQAAREVAARAAGITKEWVLDQFLKIAVNEELPAQARVQALNTLAKHTGVLHDGLSIRGDVDARTIHIHMTPEQIGAARRLLEGAPDRPYQPLRSFDHPLPDAGFLSALREADES